MGLTLGAARGVVWAHEIAAAAVVGTLFLLLFAGAELWRRRWNPPVEWTRKAVHVGGGLVAIPFPWIFATHWTVLALGLAFGLILWGTRRLGVLGSVHAVERRSEGGLYHPLAIYLLFLIGAGQPVFYLIAVLTLVLSDALAAVLGSAYGRLTYSVEGDRRSIEGSAVFFLTTFLGVHLPLLLLTETEPAASVVVALQVALLVTLLEAISLRGADNLVVPLGCYYLLVKMTPHTAEHIGGQLLAQLAIVAALAFVAWRWRMLKLSGVFAASLFFYGAYSLGGPEWLVAPAAALLAFRLLCFRPAAAGPGASADGRYQVLAVFYTGIVVGALFLANNAFETLIARPPLLAERDPLYPLYVGVLAAHLAILVRVWADGPRHRRDVRRMPASVAAGLAAVVPLGLLVAEAGSPAPSWAAAAFVCVAGFGFYDLLSLRLADTPRSAIVDLRLHSLATAAAVVLVLPIHLLWLAAA